MENSAELQEYVERYEALNATKEDLAEQFKELKAEIKGRGYDTKTVSTVVAHRKRDREDIAEEESILAVYKEALGMI
jgi:uncharacterized protein (UPF0335 family)